jgi:hypothetical protein
VKFGYQTLISKVSVVNGNHRIFAVGNVECGITAAVDSDRCPATAPGVATRWPIVVTRDDVTIVSSWKTGLQSLADAVILVADDDEAAITTTERNCISAVIPPVGDGLSESSVVELDHVVDLTPSMFANPFLVETFNVLGASITVCRRSHPVILRNIIRHRVSECLDILICSLCTEMQVSFASNRPLYR